MKAAPLVAGTAVALALDLLLFEGVLAARRTYLAPEAAPDVTGAFGDPADPTVRLVVLGDSTAAGLGATAAHTTVGGQLAARLASEGHHVVLQGFGVSGSRAGDLGPQVSRALLSAPDAAVLLIGANDASHLSTGARMLTPLADAVRRLRAADVPVVLGTCPDLLGPRAFLRPLRDLHAAVGRRVAARQTEVATASGAVAVDLARLTGPAFRADPTTLAEDLFHPSDRGYALWADALLPALRGQVGLRLPAGGS
ncbi:MAG: GDSL-type esterase/lipase family protein [Mycobacteriales bacterium]